MADKEINSQTNQEVVKQGNNELRRSIQHLPAFYRTDVNQRFTSSTIDPLIQKGSLERIDGFIGRRDAYTRKATDRYLSATDRDRMAYQLEPAVTYTTQDTKHKARRTKHKPRATNHKPQTTQHSTAQHSTAQHLSLIHI